MKRRGGDEGAGEAGKGGGLLDRLTEAEWRLRKVKESVQQQAELHSLRIAEVQLRMQHMQEERRERAELHGKQMMKMGFVSGQPVVEANEEE